MTAGSNKFTVRFRGVRGSHPSPGSGTVRYGGNTSCVEVRAGNHLILLDAGTGIVSLGNEMMKNHLPSKSERQLTTMTILFSHTHHDHTQGFAFFKPAYLPTTTCYLYGPRLRDVELEEGLATAMLSPYFPVALSELSSVLNIRSLHETEIILLEDSCSEPKVFNYYRDNHSQVPFQVCVRVMHSLAHPNGGVFVYRIEMDGKSLVYATDTEGYSGGDQKLIRFAKGADLLIHDSQYMTDDYVHGDMVVQGYGHSTVDMAAEVAAQAGAKRLALFHYDPLYDDSIIERMEMKAQEIFKDSIASHEGLEIEL
ncbi:MBL fold metallo-hydrolase [bacterium]|nr:MBL fold metallo-hydrolase [bacterium]MCI0604137.1 MBL fold metallo-hydrolase [bacterium]